MRMVTEWLVSVTLGRVDAILFMSHLGSFILDCGFAGVALSVYISKQSAYTCHKSGFSLMHLSVEFRLGARSSRLRLQHIFLLVLRRLGPRAHHSGEVNMFGFRSFAKGRSLNGIAS
jgi:hypothetical protein